MIETFFEQFELLADAPNGVQKLRELILQLAVQGKLVSQDSNDESASVLLEKIKIQKEQLIKEKRIRQTESLLPVQIDEMPYQLPRGWEWVRFGDATICRDGERIPISKDERATRQGEYDYYGASGVIDKIDHYLFDKPLLLIGEDGANLVNRSTPIAFIATGKYWVNNHAHVLDSISLDCLRYLEVFINAIDLKPFVTGTAQPKMNQAKMNSIPVSLPPLEEQKRIISRVEYLMKLCDELEERQRKRRESCIRLNEGAIAQLLSAPSAEESDRHWQRICNKFDLLYSHPENIGKLRQVILHLAVQGKLTPQTPTESAHDLIKEIRQQKQELVEKGLLKRYRSYSPVSQDEEYFQIPQNWCWAKLGEFGEFLGGGTPPKSIASYWDGNIPWISPKDMKVQHIYDSLDHISETAINASSVQIIPACSLLMVVRGMILAHSFPVAISKRDVTINQDIKALVPVKKDISDYLLLGCQALKHIVLGQVKRSSHGTCKLAFEDVENILIPLPPLREQKYILEKVTRLMKLCDELEVKLQDSYNHQEKLMETAARQLIQATANVPALR